MLRKQKPGKPIAAKTINQLVNAAEQLGQISAAGGMLGQGYRLTVADDATFPAKLSGTTSPYSWVEVYGAPGGGWTTLAGGRTGTANAYEYNAKGSLTGKVVILKPHGPGAYKFTLNRKPTGGGGGGTVTIGCGTCTTVPTIMTMTVSGACVGKAVNDTLTYSTTHLTGTSFYNYWIGTATQVDSNGDTYYQVLLYDPSRPCYLNLWKYYPSSVTASGGPAGYGPSYGWRLTGQPGNSCSPFALTVGAGFGFGTCAAQLS